MAQTKRWDLVIKNVRVVLPPDNAVPCTDLAVMGGKFARIAGDIPAKESKITHDSNGRRLVFAAQEYFAVLKRDGTTAVLKDRMLAFQGLNRVIGTPQMLELGKRYEK